MTTQPPVLFPGSSRRVVRAVLLVVLLLSVIRVSGVVRSAQTSLRGDFAATLPGAYAEKLNPRLWDSEDLRGSWGFHQRLYLYGPTQYLTLYPIVFLNSYAQIAKVLLFSYTVVLGWAFYLIWRVISAGRRADIPVLILVAAISFLFFPLLQAYGQREFEIVAFFFLVAGTYLLITGREGSAGALFGYITWFKLWPIVFLGYFLVKRQYKASAMFVVASCLTLGVAHVLFGLDRFTLLNPELIATLPGPHPEFYAKGLLPKFEPASFVHEGVDLVGTTGKGFCEGWVTPQTTMVSVRWAVCGLAYSHDWFLRAPVVFYGLSLILALAAALGFALAERRSDLGADERKFRIVWEVSLLTIGAALMLRAHYHYFIYLTLPITALAYQFAVTRAWVKLGWLASAYALLTAFVLPVSLSSRILGIDFWAFYTSHVLYLYGVLLLVGLLLWEYVAIGLRRAGGGPADVQA